ncbi:MAG: hypothetical protein VXY89_05060 [SAR324 cluster bacterium]|nr:hypothetical protein [SAR324 cluster bacterium]
MNALRTSKINWRCKLAEMWVSNEIDTIVLPEKGGVAYPSEGCFSTIIS